MLADEAMKSTLCSAAPQPEKRPFAVAAAISAVPMTGLRDFVGLRHGGGCVENGPQLTLVVIVAKVRVEQNGHLGAALLSCMQVGQDTAKFIHLY